MHISNFQSHRKKKTTEIHNSNLLVVIFLYTKKGKRNVNAWRLASMFEMFVMLITWFVFHFQFKQYNHVVFVLYIWCNITIHRNNNTKFRFVQQTYWLSIQFYYCWRFYEKKVTVWHFHYIHGWYIDSLFSHIRFLAII